jgi:hypothetical protein
VYASANVLESANAEANAIVASFMVVLPRCFCSKFSLDVFVSNRLMIFFVQPTVANGAGDAIRLLCKSAHAQIAILI